MTKALRTYWPAFLLAVLHLGLALWFASFTPYRTPGRLGHGVIPDIGAPDEVAHASYVQGLLTTGGLPVLDIDRMQSDKDYRANQYENHQPPLFYILEAGWCKVAGIGDLTDSNLGLKIRFPNALIGASGVLGVFFAAMWGFRRLDLAIGAALFPALLPMNIALSGALTNDPLLFSLISWTMALLAFALRNGWTFKLALGVGLLAGLAMLTKSSALAIAPVLVVALFLPQERRPNPKEIGVALIAFVLLAGPWLARNQREYHDPLGSKVFNLAFQDNPHKSDMLQIPGNSEFGYWTNWVGWWTARSFVGVFGYSDIFLNETGTSKTESGTAPNTLYRLSLAGFALLGLGWVMSLSSEWSKEARSVTILNGTLFGGVVLLFLTFNNQFFQGQARYLYPAFVPLGVGFASGIVQFGKQKAMVAVGAAGALLLLLAIYAGVRVPAEFDRRTQMISGSGNGLSG